MSFVLEQIRTGGDRNLGYLLGDRNAKKAVLVDPSFDPKRLVKRASLQGLEVTHIVNTHGHQDHTNGNRVAQKLTGAPVMAHSSADSSPDIAVDHGEEFPIGGLTAKILHTPGHAEDHVCVLVHGACLTGDTLFVGKVGGTQGESAARAEYESLNGVLLQLPESTTVWPGHDFGCRPASTIGLERLTNPFLRCSDFDEFLHLKANWLAYKRENGLV